MEYTEQLLTLEWLTKKTKVLIRDKYKCTCCKKRDCELHVHHIYYIKDHLAWQYPHNAFITLCKDCHKKWHEEHGLEVRTKPWRRLKPFKAPVKKINWITISKRQKKNNMCLGMLQSKEIKYKNRQTK